METRRLLLATPLACALAAGAALAGQAGEPLSIDKGQTSILISAGDRPVLEYRFADVPKKPYVERLFSPGGVNVLRDSPHDHKHHHALMFAVAVDGVDFWTENDRCGVQRHRSFPDVKTTGEDGVSGARFTETVDWLAPGANKALLVEQRTIEVPHGEDLGATLVTWQSRLEPGPGKESVRLTGSHYFGLGVRFVQSMDTVGRHFNADRKEGTIVRRDERVTPTRWSAYTAPAGDKPVTVAVFDHPDNPRHPAQFFTMRQHFAYLSATLNLWKEPMELKAGEPLVLRYGVAVWDGETGPAKVETLYQRWVGAKPQ
jgi:hypothetical protein